MIKQRLIGLLFIVFGIISVPLCDMDGTGAMLIVPLGIYLMLTKEYWLYE